MKTLIPKVSILIPVYNREFCIRECIASAVNQTFKDIEIIIIDNASTDKTFNICQEFAAIDKRIRLYRNEENIGPVKNWIECIKKSRGEFCKILFSDDLLAKNCIEMMYNRLVGGDKASFIFSNALLGESLATSSAMYFFNSENLLLEDYLWAVINGFAPISPGGILIKRSYLEKNLRLEFPTTTLQSFSSHGAGPDIMIMLLTALEKGDIQYIRNPLMFFRSHANGITASSSKDVINAYISTFSFFAKNNMPWFKWIKVQSNLWLKYLFKHKKYISPMEFSIQNEGDGTLLESFMIIFLIPLTLLRILKYKYSQIAFRVLNKNNLLLRSNF